MKKLLLLFVISFLNADVSELIKSIDDVKNHNNIYNSKIGNLYNPFKNNDNNKSLKSIVKVHKHMKAKNLELEVIFNNKAKIDSAWYKKGDKIGKMLIYKILPEKVFLKNNKKIKVLYIKSKNILRIVK